MSGSGKAQTAASKSKISEIVCECGYKMERTSCSKEYGENADTVYVCDKKLKNGKICGNMMVGKQEFFICRNPNIEQVHNEKSFGYCLVCSGIMSKEEITRTKQTRVIQQAMHMANIYEKQLNSDENKKNDPNELIAFATFVQHKTLNDEKAAKYFKKALDIINEKKDDKSMMNTKLKALNLYGAVLNQLKQYQESIKQFEIGITLYNENKSIVDPTLFANLLGNYGMMLKRIEKYDDAENKYKLGIELLVKHKSYQAAAFLCNSYALMLEQSLKKYDLASDYFLKAIEYNESIDDDSNINTIMANDYDNIGFSSGSNKQKFLFQENYIVFLRNVERLNAMEDRINLMIKRYTDYIKKDESNDGNKYILSKLYIMYSQSVMRHNKLNEKDIIIAENYLNKAIKLNINLRHVYSSYALFLQVIAFRISNKTNNIAFPFNKSDPKTFDYNISTKLELLVVGYIKSIQIEEELLISMDIKLLIGYFMYEWKSNYSFTSKIEDIKKYYKLAIESKMHIDLNSGLKFYIEPPTTFEEKTFSANQCINQLNILQKKAKEENSAYWLKCKQLCEWLLVVYPNTFDLHFIYSIVLYQYGGKYNYDLSLIHYQIGLILLQYAQHTQPTDYRKQILFAMKQQQYKELEKAIQKIKNMDKKFEAEIEQIKQINDDNKDKQLISIYRNYSLFLAKDQRDLWKSAKYYKLAYDLNDSDCLINFNYAMIVHQLNSDIKSDNYDYKKIKQEFGDYNHCDTLYKKCLNILYEQVLIEQTKEKKQEKEKQQQQEEKKEVEAQKKFSSLAMKYIEEMTDSKMREINEIESIYDYLINNYYTQDNEEIFSFWIDFHFHFLQFLILHYKDEKACKVIKIVEKYALKSFHDSSTHPQVRFLIISKVAESYSLINKHNEWKLLMDKCISEKDAVNDEPIHNACYYYGYLYETSLKDYKQAMIYYNKAMQIVAKDLNDATPTSPSPPGTKQYLAMYQSVYANSLRIVKKDYKTCELLLKQAMSLIGNSPDGAAGTVCFNMYNKYLKQQERIKNNPNYGGVDQDEVGLDDKEPDRNNKELRELYAMGNWLKSVAWAK